MVILSKFAENLLALMEEHNINAPALAEKLNLHRTSITRYLCGERLPNYEDFVALIEYFNVSADVLLGRTEYCDVESFHPIQPFGTILQQAMQSGNPIIKNAIEMYQRGDKDGINQLAQNLCKEKGISYDDMVKQIKSQFGM